MSHEIPNSKHYNSELKWGSLAGKLGRDLVFDQPYGLTARQVSASDLLMNLGLQACAETAQKVTEYLSKQAQEKNTPDGNAGIIAKQLENEQLPVFFDNTIESLKQYLLYLNSEEKTPFLSLLKMKSISANTDPKEQNFDTSPKKTSEISSAVSVDISTHVFDVALSFPGEIRSLVKDVAYELNSQIGTDSCFYDFNYSAQLARPSLDTLLQDIYRNRSKLIVVFLSGNYQRKQWCNIEFRAIREIIFERNDQQIMFIKTDDGSVEGVFKTDGFIDARDFKANEIATFIHDRLKVLKLAQSI